MLATLASALTMPHLGRIVDVFSVARTALIIVPSLACATLLMAGSSSIALLLLAIYGLRLFGQGMMTHTSMTAMARWFSAQRGRAVSVATVGHQAGEALFPLLWVVVVLWVGWRGTWVLAAVILLALALPAIHTLLRVERTPRASDGPERRAIARHWTRREVLEDPLFWLALLGVMAPGFISTTVFFHQIYLVELRGWSLQAFATGFALMSMMTVTFALVTGVLVDRYSAVRILPLFLLPLAAACFVLAGVTAQWGAFAFMFLLGIAYGISTTLFGALWPEMYGLRHLGSVRAFIVGFMVLATAMGPGLTGALIDRGVSYPLQLACMGGYALLASGLMVVVSARVRHRNQARDTQG
jgi:MFS family permease